MRCTVKNSAGCGCLALAMFAGTAAAQNFSVDFNASGSAAPASGHGGAAVTAGFWNAVTPSASGVTVPLQHMDGTASNVQMRHSATGGAKTWSYGAGEFAKLMDDVAWVETANGSIEVELLGLDEGNYRFWINSGLAPSWATYVNNQNVVTPYHALVAVYLDGQLVDSRTVSGSNGGSQYVENVNYARINVGVLATTQSVKIVITPADDAAHARAALAGFQVTRLPDTLFVVPGGAGLRNGTSWAHAMDSVQEAINVANASGGNYKQVWVKEGVYKPTATSDRTASFQLKNNVAVYGGFAGTENSLSQRVLGAHPSSLSGDVGTARVATDNSYHVLRADNTNRTAILDGFSIVSGNANGLTGQDTGAGIYADSCSATFRNLFIAYNNAVEHGGGAAIVSPNVFPGPIFDRCEFFQNASSSASGGGLFYTGVTSGFLTPILSVLNTKFIDNTCENFGGGVYAGNTSSIFAQCVFDRNTSTDGTGGGLFAGDSTPVEPIIVVRNCTLSGNHSDATGGFETQNVRPNLYNSILWGNTGNFGSVRFQNLSFTSNGFDIDYNLIEGYQQNEFLGTGNISANPMFIDANGADNIPGTRDDDFRLASNSPAIDAASNSLVMTDVADYNVNGNTIELIPFDLAMQIRYVDGPAFNSGVGPGPIVDMGAYENQTPPPPPCPVDFNDDGFLDFFDYDDYVTCFEGGACPPGKNADFNRDQFVDFFDYDEFVVAFEAGC